MPRLPRFDRRGAWFHLMSLGIARRVVFPDVTQVRELLACVAWAVRCGDPEIHAFCLVATHVHLLVRSPTGQLFAALGRDGQGSLLSATHTAGDPGGAGVRRRNDRCSA